MVPGFCRHSTATNMKYKIAKGWIWTQTLVYKTLNPRGKKNSNYTPLKSSYTQNDQLFDFKNKELDITVLFVLCLCLILK
jgi:hypothetical protein